MRRIHPCPTINASLRPHRRSPSILRITPVPYKKSAHDKTHQRGIFPNRSFPTSAIILFLRLHRKPEEALPPRDSSTSSEENDKCEPWAQRAYSPAIKKAKRPDHVVNHRWSGRHVFSGIGQEICHSQRNATSAFTISSRFRPLYQSFATSSLKQSAGLKAGML